MAQDPIVTTDWLADHLQDPGIRILDTRGYVTTRPVEPGVEAATYRGAPEEYKSGHIPGSLFVDWTKDIVDLNDPVPAQVAPPEVFAKAMGDRGVGDDTLVVVVDHMGGQFATRLWWALMYYGHISVVVLDGGWNRWVEEDRPVETETIKVEPKVFHPKPRADLRATYHDVLANLGSDDLQIIDARDPGQYQGKRRRGLRGGHVPGAINVPRELFFRESGGFLPLADVARVLDDHQIDAEKPVVAYCNGGVAATVVLFNLHRLGRVRITNYDGSWNEWGDRIDLPVEI